VVQEVLLALLAREPSYGYQLRAQLRLALGPLAESLNAGHVYVTLGRLEKSGLLRSERVEQSERPDRRAYVLTDAGRARVDGWLADTSWPKPAPHAVLGSLVAAQRAALAEADGSIAGLLLEGVVLRLQADLRWLEACARFWIEKE